MFDPAASEFAPAPESAETLPDLPHVTYIASPDTPPEIAAQIPTLNRVAAGFRDITLWGRHLSLEPDLDPTAIFQDTQRQIASATTLRQSLLSPSSPPESPPPPPPQLEKPVIVSISDSADLQLARENLIQYHHNQGNALGNALHQSELNSQHHPDVSPTTLRQAFANLAETGQGCLDLLAGRDQAVSLSPYLLTQQIDTTFRATGVDFQIVDQRDSPASCLGSKPLLRVLWGNVLQNAQRAQARKADSDLASRLSGTATSYRITFHIIDTPPQNGQPGQTRVTIEDNGPGSPGFTDFQKGRSQFGGQGIGLDKTRSRLRQFGADFTAENVTDHGSSITGFRQTLTLSHATS